MEKSFYFLSITVGPFVANNGVESFSNNYYIATTLYHSQISNELSTSNNNKPPFTLISLGKQIEIGKQNMASGTAVLFNRVTKR
jgi:hypothetical protein